MFPRHRRSSMILTMMGMGQAIGRSRAALGTPTLLDVRGLHWLHCSLFGGLILIEDAPQMIERSECSDQAHDEIIAGGPFLFTSFVLLYRLTPSFRPVFIPRLPSPLIGPFSH